MFRVVARAPSRAAFRPSYAPSAPSCSFHTSTPSSESSKTQRSRLVKKKNIVRRVELAQEAERSRPHVVLGYSPGQEWVWRNSALAKILVSDAERAPLPATKGWDRAQVSEHNEKNASYPDGARPPSSTLNFGVDKESTKVLFEQLPRVAAQRPLLNLDHRTAGDVITNAYDEALSAQLSASDQMHRILHLSNASAGGIAFENRRRIIQAFSTVDKPNDTGRSEVQAALITLRIRDLWAHMHRAPGDIHSRHSLRTLLHQRAKVLKYLKRLDRNRYDAVLPRIGLDARAIEGEIILR